MKSCMGNVRKIGYPVIFRSGMQNCRARHSPVNRGHYLKKLMRRRGIPVTSIDHPSLAAYRYSCAYPQYSPKCSHANRRIESYSRFVSGAPVARPGR